MQINLNHQNILVTGASRGIGKAISQRLLESGARVVVHYGKNQQRAQELADAFPEQTHVVAADLASPSDCEHLFKEATQKWGHLDGLVNNAGIAIKSPLDMEDSIWLRDWQNSFAVNLQAAAILSRAFVQDCLGRKQAGRMVHISSRAAFRGDTAEYLAYAASKGGMLAMSHSFARAYGKSGIRSFVIAPGFTQTDMAQEFMDEYGEGHALDDIVLEKLTQPEDIAPTVALLLSGLADHATGSSISINAGSYIR